MRIHFLFSVFILLFVISCKESNLEKSLFIDNCECDKIDFSGGFKINDSLNKFSVIVPDTSWKPWKNVEQNHSIIIMGDSIGKGFSLITINYSSYQYQDYDWKSDFDAFESTLNYTDRGEKEVGGKNIRYYILAETEEFKKAYYFVYINEINNSTLTYFMASSDSTNNDIRLCEMESFLSSTEIL